MPIDINPTAGLRRLGYLIVVACALLPLLSPLTWTWRILLSLSILGIGFGSWRKFLHRFPDALIEEPDGKLALLTRNGQRLPVNDVGLGLVRPWLVSAVLCTPVGRFDLFLPGWALPPRSHWRLRRALLGFRRSRGVV